MGYTHYFHFIKEIPEFSSELVRDVQRVVSDFADIIQYEEDVEELPVVQKNLVRFNGIGEDGHETFLVNTKPEFEFCKTARKPYDMPVCIILLLFKHHYGANFYLSSDGFEGSSLNSELVYDGVWDEAYEYVKKNFNYSIIKIGFLSTGRSGIGQISAFASSDDIANIHINDIDEDLLNLKILQIPEDNLKILMSRKPAYKAYFQLKKVNGKAVVRFAPGVVEKKAKKQIG